MEIALQLVAKEAMREEWPPSDVRILEQTGKFVLGFCARYRSF